MNAPDESLLALGLLGGRFAPRAAALLLQEANCPDVDGVRFWRLVAAFGRGSKADAVAMLRDWATPTLLSVVRVGKFTPGRHYHVLGRKFDSLDEAIAHLEEHGHAYGGLDEAFAYPIE